MTEATSAVPAKSLSMRDEGPSYETKAVVLHLAHELRQPLSTIETTAYYLRILLSQQNEKAQQQLEKMQQVVHQANWILSDAVHFLQAAPPHPQLVDLDELVSESVSETARGEPAWVQVHLAPQPTLVRLDLEQAHHLLRNVLLFFRRFCQPEPEVELRTSVAAGTVSLELSCPALALHHRDLDSMFEPFSSHLPAGSGLALASVRRIAEAHGGAAGFQPAADGTWKLIVSFPAAR